MNFILLLLKALVWIALIVYPVDIVFITIFIAILKSGGGPILVTINFVKLLKSVLRDNACFVFIRNGAVSISPDVITFNIELLLYLLELLIVELINALKDLPLHHAGSLGTRPGGTANPRHDGHNP